MVPKAISDLLGHILRSAPPRDGAEQTDGELLEAFVGQRDMRALEALVRRHAPMVWGVCRRTLPHHDAEDAFQATFLVLFRRAASIQARERLANWLYGVAHKTACKARQKAVQRSTWEPQTRTIPEPQAAGAESCRYGPEEWRILYEELGRLPEKYRSAIVLCDLEGRTRREAARQLGEKPGTVASRLARGRPLLAQRLSRRGLGLSATSGAAVWSEQTLGPLSGALLTRTIKALGLMAAGQTVTAGLLSSGVRTLADGVLRSLMLGKTKTAAVWLLLVSLVLGSAAAAYHGLAGQGPEPGEPRGQASQPPEKAPNPKPGELVPDKHGTAAGARNAAISLLRNHLFTLTVWGRSRDNPSRAAPYHGGRFGYWPSRDIEATFDPETHHWILTGSCRYDDIKGKIPIFNVPPDRVKGSDCREREWKLLLAYHPSTRTYEVQKADLPPDYQHILAYNPSTVDYEVRKPDSWRPTSNHDFARWLLGAYPEAKPSSEPITLLNLDVAVSERAKLGLKPHYTYGKKDLTVETTFRGVSIRVDHSVGGHTEQWNLQFGGPDTQFLKVAKYGGAYSPELIGPWSLGPLIAVKQCVHDGGKQTSEWSCNPGEFVVREIEVKEKKVVRLAIDFIADTEYGRPAAAKRDIRHVIRGSLRFNSLLQPSVPNLAAVAAKHRLSDHAPAGLRGMKFVRLPKGTFYMGWDGTKGSARKTEIKADFEIAVYTVTQGQWQELMWNNPSWFSRHGGGKEAVKDVTDEDLKQFPVENVSQKDILEFIKKLNEREKGKGYVYRLPTQEEWEYACRGGATTEKECSYHFYSEKPTNDLSSKQANFNGNQPFGTGAKGPYLGRTTKVGSYAPNKLGLYDMHGNIWQRPSTRGGHRGGAWNNSAETCQAIGHIATRAARPECLGFRLVRIPDQ